MSWSGSWTLWLTRISGCSGTSPVRHGWAFVMLLKFFELDATFPPVRGRVAVGSGRLSCRAGPGRPRIVGSSRSGGGWTVTCHRAQIREPSGLPEHLGRRAQAGQHGSPRLDWGLVDHVPVDHVPVVRGRRMTSCTLRSPTTLGQRPGRIAPRLTSSGSRDRTRQVGSL